MTHMRYVVDAPVPKLIGPRLRRGIVPASLPAFPGAFPGLPNRPDATSATIQDDGGEVLKHVQVFLIFWGSSWAGAAVPSVDEVRNAVVSILNGPYMSGLAQYDGIGGGRLAGTAIVSSPSPPAPFSNRDVEDMLTAQFAANTIVPRPNSNNEFLYIVVLQDGILTTEKDAVGEHDSLFAFGVNSPFAWVMNNGRLDFVTIVLSHELVESCTDPNINTITVQKSVGSPCPPNSTCEIGDICGSTSIVGGVEVQSYWSAADNRCVVPKNISRGEVTGNPVLIQGRFLHPGNFELVSALEGGGLAHYSRVNSMDFVPWFGPEEFGGDVGRFDTISMIQSNFTTGGPGNLELAALFQGTMLYYWREDVPPYIWHGPVPMNGFQQQLFTGNPVLIQGRFEHRGNFEMVVPLASGGIAHYSRVNDSPGLPWFGPNVFGTEVGRFDAVTMIQSNWTTGPKIGLLEVIARSGGDLFFYWRDDAPPYRWWGPFLANGFQPRPFTGNPVMVLSRFGDGGNFELIVPLASGGLAHYWRNNDANDRHWFGPNVFAENVGRFDQISFIQSRFSAGPGIGNLELVGRVGRDLLFYWRDDTAPFTWYGPRVVVSGL